MPTSTENRVVTLAASDLNPNGGVFCPNPSMALWSSHPKVYLSLAQSSQAQCPYCGTLYQLKAGEHVQAHG